LAELPHNTIPLLHCFQNCLLFLLQWVLLQVEWV